VTKIFILIFFAAKNAFAGGNWEVLTIDEVKISADQKIIVKFSSDLNDSLMSSVPRGTRKLALDLGNWPSGSSRRGLLCISLLGNCGPSIEETKNFYICVNRIFDSLKKNAPFLMGQIGGGAFEFSKFDREAIVVPSFIEK
jgi:hypothetical protein